MICDPCKAGRHDECTSPQTDPCQHKVTERVTVGNEVYVSEIGVQREGRMIDG